MIKKSHRNEYHSTPEGIWIRDFSLNNSPFIDINSLLTPEEYKLVLSNEIQNNRKKYPKIDSEDIVRQKIIIVSDGYKFKEKHKALSALPKDVTIIGTNQSLNHWDLVGNDCPTDKKRAMSFYVVNNPYLDCLSYLPIRKRYFPKCITSIRTNPKFLEEYNGLKYLYMPCDEGNYSGININPSYKIDDYRNSVCAAISLSYRFNVTKLLLFCCDDSFEKERPSATKLENGLWTYPQQIMSQNIIDIHLGFLKNVKVANHSSGGNLKNATYIKEEDIIGFFENE